MYGIVARVVSRLKFGLSEQCAADCTGELFGGLCI